MEVWWDQGVQRYRAWSPRGDLLAEITSLQIPGAALRWQVHLPLEHRDLYRRYSTIEDAKAAAEQAIRQHWEREAGSHAAEPSSRPDTR